MADTLPPGLAAFSSLLDAHLRRTPAWSFILFPIHGKPYSPRAWG
jgi:hypothetical protein